MASCRDPAGIQEGSVPLKAAGCAAMVSMSAHCKRSIRQDKHFMDQGRGEQSPPSPSCLSALCKCLSVVKSRVKAPPCGRSLALAQVNVVVTLWSIIVAGATQQHGHQHSQSSWGHREGSPNTNTHDIHSFTAHWHCMGTHTSLIPVN